MSTLNISKLNKEIEKVLERADEDNIKDLTEWNWDNISYYQKLSEDFIRKFKDKVTWYRISWYQKLSLEFIIENIKYIDMDGLKLNNNIIQEIKNFVCDYYE